MKLKKCRTCKGCKAFLSMDYEVKCELGYKLKKEAYVTCYGKSLYNGIPLESCPKPLTNNELLEISREATKNNNSEYVY